MTHCNKSSFAQNLYQITLLTHAFLKTDNGTLSGG